MLPISWKFVMYNKYALKILNNKFIVIGFQINLKMHDDKTLSHHKLQTN